VRLSSIVTVEDFGYAYPALHPDEEESWVLQSVDFEVEEGEFVSIMGPTGVGKTTLCLALNGIVPQSTGGVVRGNITVDGLNTKRTPVPDLAQRVGLIFQEPETQLFSMSVEAEVAFGLECLGLPPKEIAERVEWALAVVGMSGFRKRSPFHLSGGQKQRTAIASILAMTPKILVLDEPTASLDPLGKTEVFSVVRELRQRRGMTIIRVEFESERIAEFSDRVIVLRDGQVELEGTPDKIFSQVEAMEEIGLAVPQVSELAHCLNRQHSTSYNFTQLEEAYRMLTSNHKGTT
jgi:energy-coupling factor transporter ATP-binding protein EcfA2